MAIILFGIIFLVEACLDYRGKGVFFSEKFKALDKEQRNAFQKGKVFPEMLLGIGWTILGIYYRLFRPYEGQNSFLFCFLIVLVSIVPIMQLIKNNKKFFG